ncbi:MAG: glycosyltransferase family 9 protein [Myxococcota bacterium]
MIGSMTKEPSDFAKKILVRAPDHVGDCVMALPGLAHLEERLPGVILELLVQPALLPLLMTEARRPAPWPPSTDLSATALVAMRLRHEGYVAALLLKPALRAALETLFIPIRLGFPSDHRRWLLTDVVNRATPRHPNARVPFAKHGVVEQFELAEQLAVRLGATPSLQGPGIPIIPVQPVHDAVARRLLEPLRARARGPCVGLHLSTHGGALRSWAPAQFMHLGQQLQQHRRAALVLLGGPEDEAYLSNMRNMLSEPLIVVGGKSALLLLEYAALVRQLDALVVADTGPMHLAAAAGARGVALFASTDPALTGPYAGQLQPIQGETPACWPCYARVCTHQLRCHQSITPERVMALLDPLLKHGVPHV